MSNDANDIVVDVGRRAVEVELTAVRNATELSVAAATQVLLDASPSDEAAQAAADVLDVNVPNDIVTQAALDALLDSGFLAGFHNLDPNLTVNAQAVTPVLRYRAEDASDGGWAAHGYGTALALAGAGASPLYASPSHAAWPLDHEVRFQAAKYFAGSTSLGNVGTADLVVEAVLRFASSGNARQFGKGIAAGGGNPGWFMAGSAFVPRFVCNNGSTSITLVGPSVIGNTGLHHVIAFFDKSGSSLIYCDGIAGTALASPSGSWDNAHPFAIGAIGTGGSPSTDAIVYAAAWSHPDIGSHLQAALALARYNAWLGVAP